VTWLFVGKLAIQTTTQRSSLQVSGVDGKISQHKVANFRQQ